jgi:hypothetical protein
MDRVAASVPKSAGWVLQSAWSVVAVVASVVVGNACIMAGAMVAMAWEVGASPSVGRAINGVALGLMVVSYSAVLVLVMRAVSARWSVPRVVWLALGVYPIAWGLLVILSPNGPFAITPTLVTGVGAVLAWLLVQRRASSPAGVSQRPLSPG